MVKRTTVSTFLFASIAIGALMTGLVAAYAFEPAALTPDRLMGIAGFSQGASFVLFLLGVAGVALSTFPESTEREES